MSTLLTDKLTTAELAAELKRTAHTLERWRRQRIGPPWIRLQGRVLYDRHQVEAWISSQQVGGAAPQGGGQ